MLDLPYLAEQGLQLTPLNQDQSLMFGKCRLWLDSWYTASIADVNSCYADRERVFKISDFIVTHVEILYTKCVRI